MENFTKADLAELIRVTCKLENTKAALVTEDIMAAFSRALSEGKKVILPGIGKLAIRERQARTGKALGGKTYTSPAHKTVVLEISPKFKDWLNG